MPDSAPIKPLNVHQRLHAAMGEVDYIQKERKQGMRYTIVSHDAVTAKVRPVLVKHGIVYYPVAMARTQHGNRTEIDLTVRFANVDDPADRIDVVAAGYGVDDQDKGPGKAISYAVKYALLKALGLETGDDPDETQDERAAHKPDASPRSNGASHSGGSPATASPPASRPANPKPYELLKADGSIDSDYASPEAWCAALKARFNAPDADVAALWQENKGVALNIKDRFPALRIEINGKIGHPVDNLVAWVKRLVGPEAVIAP